MGKTSEGYSSSLCGKRLAKKKKNKKKSGIAKLEALYIDKIDFVVVCFVFTNTISWDEIE